MTKARLSAIVVAAFCLAALATIAVAATHGSRNKAASSGAESASIEAKLALLADKESVLAARGPHYATPEEASNDQSVPVPRCPGAASYNGPSPGVVWVQFEADDLMLAATRNSSFDLGRQQSAEHVAYEQVKIGDLPGVAMSWDGLFTTTTNPDGSTTTRGGWHRTILEWNYGGAGMRMWSDSLSSKDLVDLAASCTYTE